MRLPPIHLPSVRGRARADRGPLLLTALVVLIAVLIAAAVPPLIDRRADGAVTDVVAAAGSSAEITVAAPYDPEAPYLPRPRIPDSADQANTNAERAWAKLDSTLMSMYTAPVTEVRSTDLDVTSGSTPGRSVEMVYADSTGDDGFGAQVVYLAGAAPAAQSGRQRTSADPWPVQVGLSEATSKLLGARTGDTITAKDRNKNPIALLVSGIFRPRDPREPVWKAEPNLLRPQVFTDTRGITTSSLAVLMSADSLPDGRLALDPQDMLVTIRIRPRPGALTRAAAPTAISALTALKGASGSQPDGSPLEFNTTLDTVLRRVLGQIAVATALATVLLAAVLVALGLALLQTAELLTRRRASVLVTTRRRGAGLSGIATELALESVLLTLLAGAGGLITAAWLVGGTSLAWSLPVLLVAVTAGPAFGVLWSAQATSRKAQPANRSARRNLRITRHLRRIAIEALLVLATVGACIALSQRGVTTGDGVGASLLPALAPTLVAITGGVLLIRLIPLVLQGGLRIATRLDGSLPLLAASRAAASAGRPLPVILLVTSVALGVFALAVRATAGRRPPAGLDPEKIRPMPAGLADGLRDLAATSAGILILLAGLALVIGAAASAPDRGETQARLRTLGLTQGQTRWMTVGELLPVALIGGLSGWLLGWILAQRAIGLLSLRVLGDLPQDPALVVPLATGVPLLLLLLALVAVVAVESSVRRRERLGQVLRA
jgi:putative ABC transport system permease protein